ncbi:MAG TPA: hypothetical protein VMH87_17155 [Pseudomonadales bacterium]|nr:hypothetical protein [Pseudomonadales bacterium]
MKRKIIFTILFLALAAPCLLPAEDVWVTDIGGSVTLIGKLGKPLGTLAKVEGQMISDPKQSRSGQITAAFRVMKVDGQKLPKAQTIGLMFRSSQGMPAVHAQDLVQLNGYEAGTFVGTPDAVREQMGSDASPLDWQFESLVHVIDIQPVSSP